MTVACFRRFLPIIEYQITLTGRASQTQSSKMFFAIPFSGKGGGKKQHTKDEFEENGIASVGSEINPEKHRQNNAADRRC